MKNVKNKTARSLENVHTGDFLTNRIVYLDLLNVLAIVAVIAMHCNGLVHGNPMTRSWNTSLVVECICYFAVPIFFMISGANLMKYRERYSTKVFFKKRVIKVLIPFLFWAIIMFLWKIFIIKSININTVNSPLKILNAFFSNKEEATYYFMFEILGIYLILPLFSMLAKESNKRVLYFTVGLYFIFNATVPNICKLLKVNWNTSLGVPISGYAMYLILGYLLSETKLTKKQKVVLYIGAIIGLIYRYITTFILSKNAGVVTKTTWGYSSWHCILLTMSVFMVVKDTNICKRISENQKISNILASISGCSFGIYLIHMIVKYYYVQILHINTAVWHFRTLGVIAIYVISLIIVMIIKKVPILKKIVP